MFMEVANLGLRCSMGFEKRFAPITCKGKFSKLEKKCIGMLFSEPVDAGYNNWSLTKYSNIDFYARRATWEFGQINADSFEEIFFLILDRSCIGDKVYPTGVKKEDVIEQFKKIYHN